MIDTNHICNNRTLRTPSRVRYDAGAKVTVTATPARGYRFDGWGTPDSKDSVMTVTMNNDLSLTANFSVVPKPPKPVAEKPPKEKGKSSPLKLTVRWSGAALAAAGVFGGIYYNGAVDKEHDKYQNNYRDGHASNEPAVREMRDKIDDNISTRNIFYTIGAIGASAFAITLFF